MFLDHIASAAQPNKHSLSKISEQFDRKQCGSGIETLPSERVARGASGGAPGICKSRALINGTAASICNKRSAAGTPSQIKFCRTLYTSHRHQLSFPSFTLWKIFPCRANHELWGQRSNDIQDLLW